MTRAPWFALVAALALAGVNSQAAELYCCDEDSACAAGCGQSCCPPCPSACCPGEEEECSCPTCAKGECKCGKACSCKQKAAGKLPPCCCPPGTECVPGCKPDACPCQKAKAGLVKIKKPVGSAKICVGGCVMEVASMPRPVSRVPRVTPSLMPVMMLLESLCPGPCPPHGVVPVGHFAPAPPVPCQCPPGLPCNANACSVKLVHEADGIHICSPYLEKCICDKVAVCGPNGCLMLEGNVRLICKQHGGKVELAAERVCLDPRTGSIRLDPSKASDSVIPAGFYLNIFE